MKNKLAAGLSLLTVVSVAGAYVKLSRGVPAYQAARVIDGDTFETKEKQLIRLAETNAPEMDLCGGPEAKKGLEKLILNKSLYLKVMYRDNYMRLVSYVYSPDGSVNEKMALSGHGVYDMKWQNAESVKIKKSSDEARKNGSGVFASTCTQTTNPRNPKCNIKGNVSADRQTKLYLFPGCKSYPQTLVQLYSGDRWFCSTTEAEEAGFSKAGGCD